jgi:hypothetical protein
MSEHEPMTDADYSDWSIEELEAELADITMEIESIVDQIRDYRDFGNRSQDWFWRAQTAKRYKRREQFLVRGEIMRRARREAKQIAANNVADDLRRAIEKRDERIRNLHLTQARVNYENHVIVKWIRENCPERIEEVYALRELARAESDARERAE